MSYNGYQLVIESITNDIKVNKIIITGLSGSGKTTISKKLAKKYHLEYDGLDDQTMAAIFKHIGREKWNELSKKESMKLFKEIAIITAKKAIINQSNKTIIEATYFLYPELYENIKHFLNSGDNKIFLVDTPVSVIIERRTKREIEKKEKRLGRKLTKEEIQKKYNNSKYLIKEMLPHLNNFKKIFKGKYTLIKN